MQRRDFVKAASFAILAGGVRSVSADGPNADVFSSLLIAAPDDPSRWPAFREDLAKWREKTRKQLNYDDTLYRRKDFAWVPSSFACCFLMLCDQAFYSRDQNRCLADSWLDAGTAEFGGYDSIVLWHAYPRIGLDQRNQFDFYRDMPGGLDGLHKLTRAFQARGVKVYVDYNPWDTGTRREGVSDIDALVLLVKTLDADGIFLDTLNKGSAQFRARLDDARPGVVLESEGALPLESIHDHHMSWAQGFRDSAAPGVLRNKWFERRHMQHQIHRWNHDHTSELHTAWINGSGMMVWENVFGSWVGWSKRDRSILRSMLPIQRRYSALFAGEGWSPLVSTEMPGVYASLWEAGGLRLWTLVNRAEEKREGTLLNVQDQPGARYFDLIQGREVRVSGVGDVVSIPGAIRPRGIACVLSASGAALGTDFKRFLKDQGEIDARADFNAEFPSRAVLLKKTPAQKTSRAKTPANMAEIAPATLEMTVEYRIRETGFYGAEEYRIGRGFTLHKPAQIKKKVSLSRYAIDLTPVTNAEYYEFLKESRYRPKHAENFLKHWKNDAPPSGSEDHPVVYVDLDDARAYAAWARKRLPAEEEWQYAAQGPAGFRYPWGNEMKPEACNAGETGGTTSVTAFPNGRSPFGCYDMCGNTWEWTESERSDGRTRFCMIRGGSYFKARGSDWYMDGGPQPCHFAAKVLLIWAGLDRCATVGFRCAVDLANEAVE
jgi:formylglycine-generating enzyme required for sulfatase activity